MIEIIQVFFSGLALLPPVVQIVIVVVVPVCAVFAFSDHSLHGFASKVIKSRMKK